MHVSHTTRSLVIQLVVIAVLSIRRVSKSRLFLTEMAAFLHEDSFSNRGWEPRRKEQLDSETIEI